jgi:hypothetical protein
VGQRISVAAAKPDYQWQFNVLQGKEVNAFCLPGGKMAFWEGIMPVVENDNGIAVVMGHEVAHALARHGAERMSQAMGAQRLRFATRWQPIVALKTARSSHDPLCCYVGSGRSPRYIPIDNRHCFTHRFSPTGFILNASDSNCCHPIAPSSHSG